MRLVQILIPTGKRDAVLSVLAEEGIDYVLTDETSAREFTAAVTFPVPTNALEPVLEELRDVGINDDGYTVVVDANTVISSQFDELEEKYAEEEDEDRIAREELTSKANDLAPSLSNYGLMTVISAIIATAGLLLDSPAVVVGSMVIAPLIGPAMTANVGTVVDDQEMFARGVKLQAIGLGLAVVSATVFALLVRYANVIPPLADVTSVSQIRERVAPDFLSLVVALGAGAAGVVSLTSGVSTALVGVMIAVALIPPAATVGIGIAWGQPLVSLGSAVLLLVNVLSINLAVLVGLWYQGYRPEHWFRESDARSATVKRIGVLAVSILVLSAFLGGVTFDSYQQATTESDIREGIEGSVDPPARVLSVEVESTNTAIFQQPRRVVVTVGLPPGAEQPLLVDQLDTVADDAAGQDVATEVHYVTVERNG
ncbi:TIGR00341 family protein [Haloarcula sp. CBA1130]|uniref:TIGR00341 family protein n=1 Tax=unclassified Haloarcula TaxID=2624677 RepID=UPI001244B9CC|nr:MULTISPECIES: TIGR00341 family protein [unclassified Haloarcula]KAA9399695.1 TIGR00341 family protein [Haloarcula sp. CBA1129]KAA9401389.1 TIGR00341 family protein [Haloarcula sp. CBA1130]